jgi:hypothetical protein
MGSPWAPLCDIALTASLLLPDEISGHADVVLAQLANPVLVLSALPYADIAEVHPNICLQAGMQGRTASMCSPEATDAPIVLYEEKWTNSVNNINILS